MLRKSFAVRHAAQSSMVRLKEFDQSVGIHCTADLWRTDISVYNSTSHEEMINGRNNL